MVHMSKLEGSYQDNIIKYLEMRKIYHIRQNQIGGNKVGIPDITCCYRGIFVGIEVKRPDKFKISNAQIVNGESIINNGGKFIITHSLKEVRKLFEQIDKELDERN